MRELGLSFIRGAQFSADGEGGEVRAYWTRETAWVLEVDLHGTGHVDLTLRLGSIGQISERDLLL